MCEISVISSLSLSLSPLLLSSPSLVFQALCLEQLTARELLTRLAEKLSLSLDNVSTLVRLTSTGILVLVDDIVSWLVFGLGVAEYKFHEIRLFGKFF